MRNQIDFTLPPKDLFLNPAQDPGFHLLQPASFFWREVDRGQIHGFAASAHPEVTEKIESFLTITRRHKTFHKAVEFNAVPALLDQAAFRRSFSTANTKCLLNGAAASRLLNRYCWENEENFVDPEEQLVSYFHDCQARNQNASIPIWQGSLDPAMPFAIECRNTFNYFHFITETLGKLALLQEMDFKGPVHLHFPNHPEKTRTFVVAFALALFPELEGRLVLERAPKTYDRVLTAYDFSAAFYQFPSEVIGDLNHLAPSDAAWRGRDAYRMSQAILSMNSLPRYLPLLRTRALAAIDGMDFSHLPKRFFVGRDHAQSYTGPLEGEAQLWEMLRLFGFEYVVFEHLSPLEQIAIMANAEMMISYHGAAFANMLFANKDAYVLELGTLQTATFRWGDFWPLAHAAQCRYVSFFADYNKKNPTKDPSFDADGIVPVSISSQGVGEVMAFIVAILGKQPSLSSPGPVRQLVEKLIEVQEFAKASALLEKHAHFVEGDLALCLAKATCHKHRNEPNQELIALHMAYEADQGRWQTLISLIWCAKRCGLQDVIFWALACLRHDFPNRYGILTKDKPWLLKQS